MVTEIMLLLIVLGAAITFVAWSNTRKRKQDALDRREVEDSTGKLKQELERTANEIIGRMENHVAHLEKILDESERNRTQLEGRVAELKKVLKRTEGQSGELRDLLARLEDAGAEVDKMQRKMDAVERKLNLAMTTPLAMQASIQQPVQIPPMSPPIMTPPPVNPIMSTPPINHAPIQSTPIQSVPIQPVPPVTITQPPPVQMNPLGSITIPPLVRPTQPVKEPAPKIEVPKVEVEPVKEFDKILEESIDAQPVEKIPPRPPDRSSIILSAEKKPMTVVEGDPVKIETTRKRLNEASEAMAKNPPEEEFSSVVVEQREKASKRQKARKRSPRDVRKAAVEAIRAAEEFSTIEVEAVEEPKVAEHRAVAEVSAEPKPVEKKVLPERRELKLETTDSSIVKEMLLGGMSIEEISRETGLGRGAIELIQQLTRRQLDRR